METLRAIAGVTGPQSSLTSLSWTEAAIVVLVREGQPLRAAQIVDRIEEMSLTPTSLARTPTQSVNRDLHSAARRGDARVIPGPLRGQFHTPGVRTSAHEVAQAPERRPEGQVPHSPVPRPPRVPIEPLRDAMRRSGGLGGKHARADVDIKASRRLERTFHRSVERGWIGIYDADTLCVHHLGIHPCLVWGAGWWDTNEEADAASPPRGRVTSDASHGRSSA